MKQPLDEMTDREFFGSLALIVGIVVLFITIMWITLPTSPEPDAQTQEDAR